VVKGPDGEQIIPALEFFKEYIFAALFPRGSQEVRVLSLGSNTGSSYKKFARRIGTPGRRLVPGGGGPG